VFVTESPGAQERLLAELEVVDVELAARTAAMCTLAATRGHPTTLRTLGERAARSGLRAPVFERLARGIVETVDAVVQNFPDNVFWDFDYFVESLVEGARTSQRRPTDYLDEVFENVVAVHELFGVHSAIRFRYTHDFLYGYDWARWVQGDPEHRVGIRPFDLEFLRHSRRRGVEILQRIAAGDEDYPRLRPGRARNSFPFSREPADELRLYRDLAARRLIPVEGWRTTPELIWDRPYTELRLQRADVLGLAK
jgi:hypothetical protein